MAALGATRRQKTRLLTATAARRFVKQNYSVNIELGLCKRGRLRADLLCMNSKGQFIIVEVKSCVADFLSDSKCDKYLQYCDKFYFCFLDTTWKKLESRVKFPPQVGVLTLHYEEHAWRQKVKVVVNSRNTPMTRVLRDKLILRMAYRNGKFTQLKHIADWYKPGD